MQFIIFMFSEAHISYKCHTFPFFNMQFSTVTLIERYLINHNIQFQRQFTFQDLRGKKYPLRFDFAVFEDDGTLQCLIEYQGEQHFTNIFKIPEDTIYCKG